MNKHVEDIAERLSLRDPQLYSLEILAWVADNISLAKDADVDAALQKISGKHGTVTDFERDFPSLCFALATGVGKTRLMGAAIAYLYAAKGIKHFFVLAPNLTIYNKLITDFDPESPKYVLNGVENFAVRRPEVITGNNYKKGVDLFRRGDDTVHINIFNISKIDAKERGIRSFREEAGESYFDYLAELPDLVLLMDESHRYRAEAGMLAIEELKPVLGIELTATPQIEKGGKNPKRFKNIIYDYPLHKAMENELVKEPAVATQANFNPNDYTKKDLDNIKLRDGINIHEKTKQALKIYSKNHGKPLVKPFMLVIASDTTHAETLLTYIKSDEFFNGRYKDCVIKIDSKQGRVEKDDNVQKLLLVEAPESKIEIVIHVNMLKEGWDVTNLYTIVPLRAGKSKTLVEQAVGRGLRLPYGKRTGVEAVDRLTIVAHEHFDEIIRAAKENKYNFKSYIIEDNHVPSESVAIKPKVEDIIANTSASVFQEGAKDLPEIFIKAIESIKDVPITGRLIDKKNQQKIVKAIQEETQSNIDPVKLSNAVNQMTQDYIAHTIYIPKIESRLEGAESYKFEEFILNTEEFDFSKPDDEDIIVKSLVSDGSDSLQSSDIVPIDGDLKDHIVSNLWRRRDISYDDNADVIYDLAKQMVAYVDSLFKDKTAVRDVVQFSPKKLANMIYTQMLLHRIPGGGVSENYVAKGFIRLGTLYESYNTKHQFRDKIKNLRNINKVIFTDFKKNLYPEQKFDSEQEQLFSELLEVTGEVMKWCKPPRDNLFIPYSSGHYNPDFVVETDTDKWLCEIKAKDKMNDPDVKAKKCAAIKWCETAREYEKQHGGKAWNYALIGHDRVKPSATFRGLLKNPG